MKIKFKSLVKRVLFFVMVFTMMLSISGNMQSRKAYAATSFEQLKTQYPSGSTWSGSYKNKASQCHGFACMIGEAVTDKDPYTWQKVYNLNSLKAGDIIRSRRPHSIIVTSVSGDTITYADCNWVGTNIVKWDQTVQRSRITKKFGTLSYVMSAPTTTPNTNTTPAPSLSINSVKINGIDNAAINFSFSVSNGISAKIVIESTLTGDTITKSYTSGLSNINYSFNRIEIPTGGNQYHIYLYAYSGSASQVHKMTYGSTIGCVTFPNTIDNSQAKAITFNYKFYADLYLDLKNTYGYNEAALYKHWITYGVKEGRIASPAYSSSAYLKNNADIASAYGSTNYAKAYFHYTTYGYQEGDRIASPTFSAKYYLSKNTDVAKAYGNSNFLMAAAHFNSCGINEYRDSSEYYSGQHYRNVNGDLRNMTSYKLLLHYYQYGIGEKRIANVSNKIPVI